MPTLAAPTGLFLLLIAPILVWLALRSRRAMRPRLLWSSLAIRLLVVLLLALALADPRVPRTADRLAVAFLVDLSDSIGRAARDEAQVFVTDALKAMPSGDLAAIVAFGGDAVVERTPSRDRELRVIESSPPSGATDLSAAIRVGLGVLPTDGARRIIVLSDGNENRGHARQEARVPASVGVPIDYVTIGGALGAAEVSIRNLEAPAALRDGDTFTLRMTVDSTVETTARVILLVDGRLQSGDVLGAPLRLQPGANNIAIPRDPLAPGFHVFRVQIEPAVDTVAENNEASAFSVVSGRPRTLVVEATAGQGRYLADALRAGGIETTLAAPNAMPTDLSALRLFDAVVLVNAPASAFAPAQLRSLKTYVQSLGGGLVLVGGDRSFALGGYQRTALEEMSPLSMQRRGTRAQSSVALLLVIDNSGSMGESVGGMSKLDLAKEAAVSSLDLLTPADRLGVIAFDDRARWLREISELTDSTTATRQIRQMAQGGGTAIYPALETAFDALAKIDARVRHIVLLTDGISPSGDYESLTRQMRQANITLSTIGVGNDADVNLLRRLATDGAGRFYEGSDPYQVPQILVKETLEIARTAIVEEPFKPLPVGSSPILDGIDTAAMPPLRGYIAVTPKPASLIVLGSRQGDAILAEWQFGLGQVIAWTSDAENRWSADWLEWREFSQFWSQVVKRAVPARVDTNMQTSIAVEPDRARLSVDALDDTRAFRNELTISANVLDANGRATTVELPREGPGRYETSVPIAGDGPRLIQVVARDPSGAVVGSQSSGFIANANTEYWQLKPNAALLAAIANQTGGVERRTPVDVFAHNLRAPGAGLELAPWLIGLAIPLFLLDVAARRLRVSMTLLDRIRARLAAARQRRPRPTPIFASVLAHRSARREAIPEGVATTATRLAAARSAFASQRSATDVGGGRGSRRSPSVARPEAISQVGDGEMAPARARRPIVATAPSERGRSARPASNVSERVSPPRPATLRKPVAGSSDRPPAQTPATLTEGAGGTAARLLAAKNRGRPGSR